MFNDKSFLLQAALLIALTFAGVLWIFDGAPVPFVATTPLKPISEVPTFREALEKLSDEGRADKEISVEQTAEKEISAEQADLKRFFEYANEVVLRSKYYQDSECDVGKRPAVVVSINEYDLYRRLYRDVGLTAGGQLIKESVEASIDRLFVASLLTLEEFPVRTRSWLHTFVHPGPKEDVQAVKQCQERGRGPR